MHPLQTGLGVLREVISPVQRGLSLLGIGRHDGEEDAVAEDRDQPRVLLVGLESDQLWAQERLKTCAVSVRALPKTGPVEINLKSQDLVLFVVDNASLESMVEICTVAQKVLFDGLQEKLQAATVIIQKNREYAELDKALESVYAKTMLTVGKVTGNLRAYIGDHEGVGVRLAVKELLALDDRFNC